MDRIESWISRLQGDRLDHHVLVMKEVFNVQQV
jgi:hypothetical protein